jgi:hypothetical protein
MIDIAHAVISLRPNTEWSMNGDDVEGIIWHTPDVEPLTTAEVEAEIVRLESESEAAAAEKAAARAVLLERLGISEEEAILLIGGIQ